MKVKDCFIFGMVVLAAMFMFIDVLNKNTQDEMKLKFLTAANSQKSSQVSVNKRTSLKKVNAVPLKVETSFQNETKSSKQILHLESDRYAKYIEECVKEAFGELDEEFSSILLLLMHKSGDVYAYGVRGFSVENNARLENVLKSIAPFQPFPDELKADILAIKVYVDGRKGIRAQCDNSYDKFLDNSGVRNEKLVSSTKVTSAHLDAFGESHGERSVSSFTSRIAWGVDMAHWKPYTAYNNEVIILADYDRITGALKNIRFEKKSPYNEANKAALDAMNKMNYRKELKKVDFKKYPNVSIKGVFTVE